MDNLQNLLRLAGETPIFGAAPRILVVLFFILGLLLIVYFPWESWKGWNDNSKMRRLSTSESRRKPYPNWTEMKILSFLFVIFVALLFMGWIVLGNLPSFSLATMQRLTAGGREPVLFTVRLLLSGSILLSFVFIAMIPVIFFDWNRGKVKGGGGMLGMAQTKSGTGPEKRKSDPN